MIEGGTVLPSPPTHDEDSAREARVSRVDGYEEAARPQQRRVEERPHAARSGQADELGPATGGGGEGRGVCGQSSPSWQPPTLLLLLLLLTG